MIIKKLTLHNWKNFQKLEVALSERCFIIGANAAGKSNLIDALRFLRDIAKQSGGLQTAVEERGGVTKIRCLSARTNTNISIEVELGEPESNIVTWKYLLSFAHTGGGIRKNQAVILTERVWHDSILILNRPETDQEDSETLKYTHLEQVTANKDFREIQTFFQNIEYLNVVPQLIRESGSYLQTQGKEDFYGRNFLEKLALMNDRTRNAYFNRINDILKIAVPQLENLQFVTDVKGIPHLEARYIHWRAKGSKQQEMQFSDGTLRLIGFLFALLYSSGVVLLEEPEINLHSGIVKQLPEFIAKIQRYKMKQVIITTHSYDILSNEGISTNEVVVLMPTREGTDVKIAANIPEIQTIVDAGLTIADATMPTTTPEQINEISQVKSWSK